MTHITINPTGGDDSTMLANAAAVASILDFSAETFSVLAFPSAHNTSYISKGVATINCNPTTGNPVPGALVTGGNYEGLNFSSQNANLTNQYIGVSGNNIRAIRCGFQGFRDTTNDCAWGNLISSASNVVLDQCTYGNNSQSDIALTDSVSNITIISPYNSVTPGVFLNIEPNTGTGVTGLSCLGGHYSKMTLLEPLDTGYSSKYNVATGCTIDNLVYDGAGMKFYGCKVGTLTSIAGSTIYAGDFLCDTVDISPNMLTDQYLFDISTTDTNTFWKIDSGTFARVNDSTQGKYLTLNAGNALQQAEFETRNFVPAWQFQDYVGFIRNRTDNTGSGASVCDHIAIDWYNGATFISTTTIKSARAAVNASSGWNNDTWVCQSPANTTQYKMRIANSLAGASKARYDVAVVFMGDSSLVGNGQGNMQQVITMMASPQFPNTWYQSHVPASGVNNGYAGGFVGERVINATPAVGSPKSWVTTVAGTGGVFGTVVSEGNL